jgi:riboflavin kinase/FMN adenylyltransferase
MFKTDAPLLETYLFDFTGDLYGKHLAVALIAYLRPEMKFDSLDALKAQMTKDSEAARAVLDRAGGGC